MKRFLFLLVAVTLVTACSDDNEYTQGEKDGIYAACVGQINQFNGLVTDPALVDEITDEQEVAICNCFVGKFTATFERDDFKEGRVSLDLDQNEAAYDMYDTCGTENARDELYLVE